MKLALQRAAVLFLPVVLWIAHPSPGLTARNEAIVEVRIKAKRFKFVPSQIRVRAGHVVEIALSSQDVRHGFRILGTDIDLEIPARGRGEVRVRFVPESPGRYRFECSRMCGAGHASMRGVIRVEEEK